MFAVLVADKEPSILLQAMDMVTDAGLVVFGASTASQVFQMLEEHAEICVLFADADCLGSMNGADVARTVHKRWPQMTIMLTSTHDTARTVDMPETFLRFPKPYPQKVVLDAMFDALAKFVVRGATGNPTLPIQ